MGLGAPEGSETEYEWILRMCRLEDERGQLPEGGFAGGAFAIRNGTRRRFLRLLEARVTVLRGEGEP